MQFYASVIRILSDDTVIQVEKKRKVYSIDPRRFKGDKQTKGKDWKNH